MTISIKLESQDPKFSLNLVFSDGNHCLKLPCSISKDSYSFQLNYDTKHLTIAFDFREQAMILLVKFLLGHPVNAGKSHLLMLGEKVIDVLVHIGTTIG